MELLALTCQQCSAPLKVPSGAKFVTCTHCGAQLAVRRTDSVAYTETLEAIDARTERMAEQLDDLHRRTAVAELDRQWEVDRERFYVTGKNGVRHLPTRGGSAVGGIVAVIFGVIWTTATLGIGGGLTGAIRDAPGPAGLFFLLFPLAGLAVIGFGLFAAIDGFGKASAYDQAEAEYRRRRAELLRAAGDDANER